MIEVNSDISYLGRDIREWCMSSDDIEAEDIKRKYYSDEVEFKPSDKVYYFVEYMSQSEAAREHRSLFAAGGHLRRDLEKSPRRDNY